MSNTIIQNQANVTYAGASSVNATFSSACTNPSLIVAGITSDDSSATFTISDGVNAGNYVQDSYGTDTSAHGACAIQKKQNTSTTALTVSATISVSTYGGLKIYEITGAPTSSELDVANGAGGTASANTISFTTGSANCTVICVGTHYPAGATADTSYTQAFAEYNQFWSYHYGEHLADAGAIGAKTLTFNLGSEDRWSMAVAAYKTSGVAEVLSAQISI